MIVIVFLGTIYQGDLGLHMTQKIYFSSWVHWIYFIPLPAGRLLMMVMFINLCALSLRKSLWQYKKLGILIVHFGALLLLFGGGVTAYFSYEGRMTIKEGNSSNYIEDYFTKELAVISSDSTSSAFSEDQLFSSNTLNFNNGSIDFDIKIISFLVNSKPIKRLESCQECKGKFQSYQLVELKHQKEFEQNNSAVIFEIKGIDDITDGVYASMIFENENNVVDFYGDQLRIMLRPKRTEIPFTIELVNFEEVLHPGTEIAKSYSSEVILNTGELNRDVVISMNEPLRHREYTFFQSAFNRADNAEYSTLAVVKNYGRLFPYISSIVMCIGLLLHLIMIFLSRLSRQKAKQ